MTISNKTKIIPIDSEHFSVWSSLNEYNINDNVNLNKLKGVNMSNFSGSCLCGSVQYKSTSDPLIIQNCHCDQCRKATGSVFLTNLFIKEENFNLSGETNNFIHLSF